MSTRLNFTKSRNNGKKYGRKKTRKFGIINNIFSRRKKPKNLGYLQISKKEKEKQEEKEKEKQEEKKKQEEKEKEKEKEKQEEKEKEKQKEKRKQLMKLLTGNSDELFDSDDSQKTSPASSQVRKGLLFGLPKEKIPVDFNFVKKGEGKAIGERSMSPVKTPPPYGHINAKRRNTQTQKSEELMEIGLTPKKKKTKKKKTKKKKTKKKKKKPTTSRRKGKRRRLRSRSRRR